MSGKNTWIFEIKKEATGEILHKYCFYGVDSEDAHTNCINWTEKQYNFTCIADLTEGNIERNEKRREETKLETEMLKDTKDQFLSILKTRKVTTIQPLKEF